MFKTFRCKTIKRVGFKSCSQKKKDNKKTLIFDLDETLIHCNDNQNIKSDAEIQVVFPTGEKIMAGINVRPGA